MQIFEPKRSGGAWRVHFEARDFPRRELIEPKLAKQGFELGEQYRGTATDPFLLEALTASPQVILRALALSDFEYVRPASYSTSSEVAAWGTRFGFADLAAWGSFHRYATAALPKLPATSQSAYAAYVYSLIKQDRGAGNQIAGILLALSGSGKSPILSRSQLEAYMRVRGAYGSKMSIKQVEHLITGFTLVEALELIAADLSPQQIDDVLEIRRDFRYEASVSELIAMLETALHRRLRALMA